MAFSLIAVTLDTDIAIVGVQNLSCGRPGASILPELFCQLGDTSRSRLSMILGVIWGPHFES